MLSLDIARTIHEDREREIRELLRVRALLRDQATEAADRASKAERRPATTPERRPATAPGRPAADPSP